MLNKRGQLTVFIILAIAIVVVVILLFTRTELGLFLTEKPPLEQIKTCAQESVEQAVDVISVQGGSIAPENYYLYQGNKVEYLCYAENYYERCIMQKPLLKQSIENEIEEYIENKVINCVDNIKSSLQGQGYSVTSKQPEIVIEIVPNNILISLEGIDLVIRKDQAESYKSIKTDLDSNYYDLLLTASSILNWEARYGDSETMNYMMYYPALKVEKKEQSDGSTIYILTNRNSLDKFMFASRSGAMPPGLIGL